MAEAAIVYGIVAFAAGWTGWTLVLRGLWRRRKPAAKTPCGPDCACGE